MTGFGALSGDISPYLLLLVAAALPNAVWRWIAVFATARLDDRSPVFAWVRHVASCLVAGVVAQLLLAPSGALAGVPIGVRFGALIAAAIIWLVARRNLLIGWIGGVGLLVLAAAYL